MGKIDREGLDVHSAIELYIDCVVYEWKKVAAN